MSRCCNHRNNDSLVDSLFRNIGKVVIIFTDAGGPAGAGFTGLLAAVSDDTCKLVTTLPSAPINPFSGNILGNRNGNGCGRNGCERNDEEFGNLCNGNRRCHNFGSSVIIPIDQITGCVFSEV